MAAGLGGGELPLLTSLNLFPGQPWGGLAWLLGRDTASPCPQLQLPHSPSPCLTSHPWVKHHASSAEWVSLQGAARAAYKVCNAAISRKKECGGDSPTNTGQCLTHPYSGLEAFQYLY